MRGWKMTAGLALIAALAALFAPRLMQATQPAVQVPEHVEIPVVITDTGHAPIQPAVHRPSASTIPELDSATTTRVLLPVVPVAPIPPPVPQRVWDDCPGCGMG